jgi:folate-binding protein YgfZ
MVTDMRVLNDRERTWLDVPASLAESLQARLEALLFAEDAQIADVSSTVAIVDVHGPVAPRMVVGEAVVRDDAFELPGFSGFLPTAEAAAFISRMRERGAVETSLETLDVIRVEAGRPAFLVDLDDHTIPLEAGLERRAISFTKGCYVGQEVIVRVMHRGGGRVARKLVGLRFSPKDVVKTGDVVRADGRDIGRVTSVVWSPALDTVIALGFVHRDYAAPGTRVEAVTTRGAAVAEVASLPFVPLALRLQQSAP